MDADIQILLAAAAAYVDVEMAKRDRILDGPTRDLMIRFMAEFSVTAVTEALRQNSEATK